MLVGGCHAIALAWRERRAWPVELVALWLLVPVALSFLVSLVQPMFLAEEDERGLWLVIREADARMKPAQLLPLQASLRESFQLVEQRGFAGVEVELYVR